MKPGAKGTTNSSLTTSLMCGMRKKGAFFLQGVHMKCANQDVRSTFTIIGQKLFFFNSLLPGVFLLTGDLRLYKTSTGGKDKIKKIMLDQIRY